MLTNSAYLPNLGSYTETFSLLIVGLLRFLLGVVVESVTVSVHKLVSEAIAHCEVLWEFVMPISLCKVSHKTN